MSNAFGAQALPALAGRALLPLWAMIPVFRLAFCHVHDTMQIGHLHGVALSIGTSLAHHPWA